MFSRKTRGQKNIHVLESSLTRFGGERSNKTLPLKSKAYMVLGRAYGVEIQQENAPHTSVRFLVTHEWGIQWHISDNVGDQFLNKLENKL